MFPLRPFFFILVTLVSVASSQSESGVHHSEKIVEVAKTFINSKKTFFSSPEFVFKVLKLAGVNINMPFSARSWNTIEEWGEDDCWKPRLSENHPDPHIGDVVSNGERVGIVISLNPGKTATVVVKHVRETKLGFRNDEQFVIWCYVCELKKS